jgi:hypothetical protein
MAEINIPTGPIDFEPMNAIRCDRMEPSAPVNRQALLSALDGVELGARDRLIVDWLSGWESSTVATVCSWLGRVRNYAERIEYACRWTGWNNIDGRDRQVVKYDMCGKGEAGMSEARMIRDRTRAWQARQSLPVDAVVVSRPVHEWTIVQEADHA